MQEDMGFGTEEKEFTRLGKEREDVQCIKHNWLKISFFLMVSQMRREAGDGKTNTGRKKYSLTSPRFSSDYHVK